MKKYLSFVIFASLMILVVGQKGHSQYSRRKAALVHILQTRGPDGIVTTQVKNMPAVTARIFSYSRPAQYGVVVAHDIMVPMRDGVKLATDLYFPAVDGHRAPGKFPAILDRTPYDKTPRAAQGNDPWYFAMRGYVFVFQDVRGHGKSQGHFMIYTNEGNDGYDTVEWIAKQPWSNGEVGTSGYSYDAATQNALAREDPPHLKSMFIGYGTANYHDDTEANQGAFGLSHDILYTMTHAMNSRVARSNPVIMHHLQYEHAHIYEWMRMPLSKTIQLFDGVPNAKAWYTSWVNHPSIDSYWRQNGYMFEGFYKDYPDIPIYFMGGWYDMFLRGTITNYDGLSKIHKSPTLLTICGSIHGPLAASRRVQNDVDMGPNAPVDWDEMRLQWFDQTLKGMNTGVLSQPRVKLFIMGGGSGEKTKQGHLLHGGHWAEFSHWPVPGAKPTDYYLQPDGGLSTTQPPAGAKPDTYSFNPKNPVPQLGGNYSFPSGWGPRDQTCSVTIWPCKNNLPLSARPDVMVYETAPLQHNVTVAGPLTVELWASSSAVDTDFTVKLIDQYPPSEDYPQGYAMILMDSIRRGRYRDSLETPKLMVPGKPYLFTIDLWATANTFLKGHRIRLDVSSSNFPRYDVNPNTGQRIGYQTHEVIARNTIYHDRAHPSYVILPLLGTTQARARGVPGRRSDPNGYAGEESRNWSRPESGSDNR